MNVTTATTIMDAELHQVFSLRTRIIQNRAGPIVGRAQLQIKVIWSLTLLSCRPRFEPQSPPRDPAHPLPTPSSPSAITTIEAGGDARPPSLSRVVSIFMGLPGAFARWLSH